MPRRLFLALLLLVITPIVLLGWLSANAARQNERTAKETLAKLLSTQLYDANGQIATVFQSYAGQLESELADEYDSIEVLRRLRREMPIVRQGIMVGNGGQLLFPTEVDLTSRSSAEVAAALSGMIDARPRFSESSLESPSSEDVFDDEMTQLATDDNRIFGKSSRLSESEITAGPKLVANESTKIVQSKSSIGRAKILQESDTEYLNQTDSQESQQATEAELKRESAWQQWYMGDGAQVVYWIHRRDGYSVGVLLERSRWMADLIAALPDDRSRQDSWSIKGSLPTKAAPTPGRSESTPIGSVRLVDEANRTIYRWGDVAAFKRAPLAVEALAEPLASWQLRLYVDPALTPKTSLLPLYLSLGGVGLLLLLVGVYVLTSVRRQIADARSRVNFAGQVSHELRTPLTNIRLYTELAESDLSKLADNPSIQAMAGRLQVIDHESRRLQRLVSGVLEMIRPSGKRIGVRRQSADVCQLIRQICQHSNPASRPPN